MDQADVILSTTCQRLVGQRRIHGKPGWSHRSAPLNIVCFRYKAGGLNVAELNQLNQELLVRLHESDIAAPSYTTLNGNYALRVANTNQRSRREDFDLLVEAVLRLGHQLEKEFVLSNGAQSSS